MKLFKKLNAFYSVYSRDSGFIPIPGLAAVHRAVPPRPRGRPRDHDLASLHPRNLPSCRPGHLRKLPSGEQRSRRTAAAEAAAAENFLSDRGRTVGAAT